MTIPKRTKKKPTTTTKERGLQGPPINPDTRIGKCPGMEVIKIPEWARIDKTKTAYTLLHDCYD